MIRPLNPKDIPALFCVSLPVREVPGEWPEQSAPTSCPARIPKSWCAAAGRAIPHPLIAALLRSASSLSPAAGSVRLWDMYPDKSLMLRNIPALKYNPTPPAADCATPSGPVHRTEAAACRTAKLYRILVRQIRQSQLFQSKQHSGSVFQPGISKPRLKRALNDPLADTRRLPRQTARPAARSGSSPGRR